MAPYKVTFHPDAFLEYEALWAGIEASSNGRLYDDLTSLMGYAKHLEQFGEHALMTSFRVPNIGPPKGPWPSDRSVCYRIEGALGFAFLFNPQTEEFMVLSLGSKREIFQRYRSFELIDRGLEFLKGEVST